MKKINLVSILILVVLVLVTPGCLEKFDFNIYDGSTTYEPYPTKVKYEVSYGYYINCSGHKDYKILYKCDLPDETNCVDVDNIILFHNLSYEQTEIANNTMINWNVTGERNKNYKLGLSAEIEAESFLVPDLNGNNAATIQEIKTNYSDIYDKYTREQQVNCKKYIDPNDVEIKAKALEVAGQADTTNSFLIAKELFIWLKGNTNYAIHLVGNDVQMAHETYTLRTGDCDDLSFLYISMCRSVGIPARFVRGISINNANGSVTGIPHEWAEVFVGKNIGRDGWIPVECAGVAEDKDKIKTEVNQNFGIERAHHLRLFEDQGSDESLNVSMSGPLIKYGSETDGTFEMNSFIIIHDYEVLKEDKLYIDSSGNRKYIS